MRIFSVISLMLLLIGFSGCSFLHNLFEKGKHIDYGYDMCTLITGKVIDNSTRNPIENASIKVYYFKTFLYTDSTDNMGIYDSDKIEIGFWSSKNEISELRAKPPKREKLDLRIVFEKPGYKRHDLLVAVEFIYCSPHPQEVTIGEVKVEDVYLVREWVQSENNMSKWVGKGCTVLHHLAQGTVSKKIKKLK